MSKSVEEVRAEIPFLRTGIIYLDNAATTPTPQPVLDAMMEYFREYGVNIGRGVYRAAREATEEFEVARESIAKTIGAKPEEIAYTKNATEGLNLVAQGLNLKRGDKVVATVLEHHSNLLPWQRLERARGVDLELIPATRECMIRPESVERAIDGRTKLVTLHHVSNAVGSIQPVAEIGKIAEEHDVLFLVDAAQAVGHMPVDVREIGCDFLVAPGHKGLLGPQGTGFLYIREDRQEILDPLLVGGGIVGSIEEHSYRLVGPPQIFDAGTPNIPGIIGLGRAAEYVLEIGLERIAERERRLTKRMLEISEIDGIEVYGPEDINRRGGVVSFNVSGMNPHEVSAILDETAKIATRSGCHCASLAMRHLGVEGSVRASVHYFNLEEEIEKFVEAVRQVARESGG